jgi:uncharacterized membrane protein
MSDTPRPPQSTGLAPNVAGALSYVLGPVTGVLFLILERESRFVRFHAAQSVVVGVAWIVFSVVLNVVIAMLSAIPVLGWLVAVLAIFLWAGIGLGALGFWLFLMFRAYQGDEWEVPYLAAYARRLAAPPAIAPPH